MKRIGALAAVIISLSPLTAFAQDTRDPETLDKKPPAPRTLDELGEPSSEGELLVPTPPEWRMKYDDARAKLLTGEFADAAAKFEELEKTAVNRVDRAIAHEQKTLASDWASRGLAFVSQKDLGESSATAKALDKRTTDELVSLYTNSVFYGLGSGIWLATLTKPTSAAGGVLPAIALTGASVGAVIGLDSGRGMRYGVPQSIVTGLYIGLEEGIVWGLYANTNSHGDTTSSTATLIWGASTVGAVAGGALGASLGTTPGRSSWVGSTALWTGTIGGFLAGALASDKKPEQPALAVAGLGLSLGTAVGLATASSVSPSIARVRFLDLGGLSGGLLVGGLYAALGDKNSNGHVAAGLVGLGAAGGLTAAWFLTASMPEDRLRDGNGPIAKMRPLLLPANGGAMMGVGGALD
jgi:hypothetical protein